MKHEQQAHLAITVNISITHETQLLRSSFSNACRPDDEISGKNLDEKYLMNVSIPPLDSYQWPALLQPLVSTSDRSNQGVTSGVPSGVLEQNPSVALQDKRRQEAWQCLLMPQLNVRLLVPVGFLL